MTDRPDFFRDFGIIPFGVSPPPETVRAWLPRGHVIGQYVFTLLMAGLGIGMGLLAAFTLPAPVKRSPPSPCRRPSAASSTW